MEPSGFHMDTAVDHRSLVRVQAAHVLLQAVTLREPFGTVGAAVRSLSHVDAQVAAQVTALLEVDVAVRTGEPAAPVLPPPVYQQAVPVLEPLAALTARVRLSSRVRRQVVAQRAAARERLTADRTPVAPPDGGGCPRSGLRAAARGLHSRTPSSRCRTIGGDVPSPSSGDVTAPLCLAGR